MAFSRIQPVRHAPQLAPAVPLTRSQRSLGYRSDQSRPPPLSRAEGPFGHGVLSDIVLSDTIRFAMPRSPPRRCRSSVTTIPRIPFGSVATFPPASRRGALRAWRSLGCHSLGYRPVRHGPQPAPAVPLLGHNDPSGTVQFVVTPAASCSFPLRMALSRTPSRSLCRLALGLAPLS